MSSKTMVVVTVMALATGASAAVGSAHWTGEENGFWTNRNNWAERIVPGFVEGDSPLPDTDATLRLTTSAYFDGSNLTGAGETTIDLDGLVDISYLEFTGSQQFTLGASGTQTLPIEHAGALAVLGTQPPVLTARLLMLACGNHSYWGGSNNDRPRIAITNNAPTELVINAYGGYTGTDPSEAALECCGAGKIRLAGTVEVKPSIHIFMKFDRSGKLVIDTIVGVREIVADRYTTTYAQQVEITANGRLYGSVPLYGLFNLIYPLVISGEGEVLFGGGRFRASENPPRWNNTPEAIGANLSISTRVSARCTSWDKPADWYPGYTVGNNPSGVLELLGDENYATGTVEIVCGTLKTAQIGRANTDGVYTNASRIGFGEVTLTGNGRLLYVGTGEESDKPFVITNAVRAYTENPASFSSIGVIEQAGTGLLRLTSPVRVDCASGTLALDSSVAAPAEWAGVLADTADDQVLNLEKRGAGTWTLSASNTYTGTTKLMNGTLALAAGASIADSSALIFAGGTLDLQEEEAAREVALPPVTLTGGTCAMRVGRNVHVTFAAPTRTAGTLDLVIVELPASVTVTGLVAGDAPAYLTVNGKPAQVSASGEVTTLGETYWKTATSGDWSDSAKWTAGVPTVDHEARITTRGDSYTVTADTSIPVAPSIMLRNAQDAATATLSVGDGVSLSSAGNGLAVGAGGRFSVGAGGAYVFSNEAAVTSTFSDPVVTVTDGGQFVTSGSTSFTNFSGRVVIGGAASSVTSRFTVAGGTCMLSPRDNPNGLERVDILQGGLFEASGDGVVDFVTHHQSASVINLGGGSVDFSGNAVLRGWHGTNTVVGKVYGCFLTLGSGLTTFRDNAQLDVNYGDVDVSFYVFANAPGEVATLTFADHAKMARTRKGSKYGNLMIGGYGGRGIVNLDSDQAHSKDASTQAFFSIFVGATWGTDERITTGELNISDGTLIAGSYGLFVGTRARGGVSSQFAATATGVVRVKGGTLKVTGAAAISPAWGCSAPYGTRIGDAFGAWYTKHQDIHGRLEVSSGTFENESGIFFVGYGRADGEVVQTGGEVKVNANLNAHMDISDVYGGGTLYATNNPAAIGVAGGTGRFIISNGTCTVGAPLFVGGVRTNNFVNLRTTVGSGSYAMYSDYWNINVRYDERHDAVGQLTVAGGTLTAVNPIYVGTDGSGTLEIGPEGSLTAKAIVLSNQTASVARFVFGANGVGTARTGRLVIAEGAKLEVDISDYAGGRGNLSLIAADSVEGAFAAGDITITGAGARPEFAGAQVVQSATGLRLRIPRGAVIMFR